ncbi:MAG TPA: SDR family NAD(P)-dependent oxidoreductase [Stellaceae bacterium]|jgi:NAD(P)-dependent dehydrogenase (short-subunit alcohol dehydrogenase family)|nr:SDR family NAD(P)-dependent oxidoreductase [Stellaceae bacterium]
MTAEEAIRFDDRVAIVTGAGNGLGRCHALGLAARGAKVVVNDAGGAVDGTGHSPAAEKIVAAIEAAGGTAIADTADVTDPAQVAAMVERTARRWGRIDILVNNAGILRDKSFGKLTAEDFRAVIEVHVMGAFHMAKAVWDGMRAQNYGRIVFTTSSSGLYGNFGQANYGTAKAALVGLMNVLDIEGRKNDIRVNILSPTAATRMTEALLPEEDRALLDPASVTPGLLYLVSDEAPSGVMLCAGAGCFARAEVVETPGLYLPPGERSPETIARRFAEISAPEGAATLPDAWAQTKKYVALARQAQKPR